MANTCTAADAGVIRRIESTNSNGEVMFSRCTMQAVIFVLLASVTAHAQEEDPSKIFEQANVQMDMGNFKDSLSLF